MVAAGFAAIVAATVTGATLRGETREAPTTAEFCATAEWPMIPAECLDGAGDRQVRLIGDAAPVVVQQVAASMEERFAVAFQ
jgi:predicted homoserine dehydrogenase-like protein